MTNDQMKDGVLGTIIKPATRFANFAKAREMVEQLRAGGEMDDWKYEIVEDGPLCLVAAYDEEGELAGYF